MELLDAFILGLIQGITEWLPVSSKSQIMLASMGLFDIAPENALSLSIYLHIGTMLAAIVYFRNEIYQLLKRTVVEPRDKLFQFLVVSTLCTGAIGVPLFIFVKDVFVTMNGEAFTGVIGIGLVFTGVLLLKSKQTGGRTEKGLVLKDSVIAGVAQSLSVLPGVSRSGVTTASLLWIGFSQESALKLSFLMSILAVSGAEVGFSILKGFSGIGVAEGAVMIISSFAFGIISIEFLLRIARNLSFAYFCIFIGIVSLVPLVYLMF